MICPSCGQENPEGFRLCGMCGTPLGPAAAAPREERKVVTVLFADLVGFTSRSEQLDPEDVRAMLGPYWQRLRDELERFGGTVEKFIGDAVVALFGAPVAHEDDPERGVRAALAIRDWAREQVEFQVRIGITTGEALVQLGAQPLAGEGMVSGDVVNVASRVQAAAPANAVLVDERSYRATRQLIDYGEASRIEAKGKAEPVRVWEALQPRSRFGVDLVEHGRTPLVGRERELNVLRAALARAREERSPQLVTLVGVPGIGKSRLVYELMKTTGDDPRGMVTWRQGRSLPYGDGVSFWALAEIVKAQAGILETDAEAAAGAKLVRAVQALIDDISEAEWVERHLRPLAGVGGDAEVSRDRSEAFASWRRFLEALAESRPAVLVFEDLHWADDGLLDFVDSLVEWVSDVALLIVATARPELLERQPNWSGGKANSTTLSLAPLSDSETACFVRELVAGDELSSDTERALINGAAGNALYAEQYTRMWQERGHSEQLSPPETVHAVIAARLDALSPSEKCVLQNAAVFGKVFWSGAVAAVDGVGDDEVAGCLHTLERREFVQRSRRSSVERQTEYTFRHVLVRDVAYGQIPRTARGNKHERAAAWIESLERLDDHAEMLAHHYVCALELVAATGGGSDELDAQAALSLIRAGDRATALNAFPSAKPYYERALELLSANDPHRPQVLFGWACALFAIGDERRDEAFETARAALFDAGDIETAAVADTQLASVAWYRGQRERTDEYLQRAMALVDERAPSPSKARVLANVARFQMLAAEYGTAINVGREALEMAQSFHLDETVAQTLITIGMARHSAGDDEGASEIERGVEVALASNHLAAAARGYQNLSAATDDAVRGLELVEASERLWLRFGDVGGARYSQATRAGKLFAMGHWDEALAAIDAFIADCEAGHPHNMEAMLRRCRAWARLGRDDVTGALDETNISLELARRAKDPQVLFATLGDAAELYTRLGRLPEAKALATELLAANPYAARWTLSFLLIAERLGMEDEARRAFTNADQEQRADAITLAVAKGRHVDAVEIAAANSLLSLAAELRVAAAEALLKDRRYDDAVSQLQQAVAFYRSVGATRFIRETETLLATIESESEEPAPQPLA